jgi:hypothetical protein
MTVGPNLNAMGVVPSSGSVPLRLPRDRPVHNSPSFVISASGAVAIHHTCYTDLDIFRAATDGHKKSGRESHAAHPDRLRWLPFLLSVSPTRRPSIQVDNAERQ